MSKDIFPQTTADLAAARKKLTPHIHDAFTVFSEHARIRRLLWTRSRK